MEVKHARASAVQWSTNQNSTNSNNTRLIELAERWHMEKEILAERPEAAGEPIGALNPGMAWQY